MPTTSSHKIFYEDARKLAQLKDNSVELILTSPPYPMIQMWDKIFAKQNKKIDKNLKDGNGAKAFELMHTELDKVWSESFRVLKNGGIACINIGDATRTLNGNFSLYPNHSRILNYFFEIGFDNLPCIIWRKQTNAPNKFMGSGMLPVGAYTTLEHEYILIFRKNEKRKFNSEEEKAKRQESSFFWEERNIWFSDIWFDIKGTKQKISNQKTRERNGAFPFELAYRLINMYSVKGDTVLDPFLGTGTTSLAALAAERNSIGIEIDKSFKSLIEESLSKAKDFSNMIIEKRIERHNEFIAERSAKKKEIKYKNLKYHFPVMTKTERNIIFNKVAKVEKEKINKENDKFVAEYEN